jgi:hypothetical protein
MPIDLEDMTLVQRVQAGMMDPTVGSGESFSPRFLVLLFLRLANLRDFAEEQLAFNQQLAIRVRALEIRTGTHRADSSEVYLRLIVDSVDLHE